MQLNQLKYAIQVARLLSFSKAADHLCVTQPALSHQIQNLEEELGILLFERKTRSVRLTQAGEVFVSGAEKVLADIQALRDSMSEFKLVRTGSLRVGMTSVPIVKGLMKLISFFQSEYPGIHVQIVETAGSKDLVTMLESGTIDIAFIISYADAMKQGKIRYYPLATGQVVLVIGAAHRLSRKETVKLSDLSEDPFVFAGSGLSMHAVALKMCRDSGFKPKIVCECDQVETLFKLVANGAGVGLVSSQTVESHQPEGVCVVALEGSVERFSCLAIPQDRLRSPTVALFRDFALDAMSRAG